MSQENVEIVRDVFAAINRRDFDAAYKHAAPDFEFDFSRAVGPLHGVFKLDQIRGFWDEVFGVWESVRIEADEFIEAGEQVVTPMNDVYRGRDGIEVRVRPCLVWTIRDGVIERVTMYQERQDALEAAGLSE